MSLIRYKGFSMFSQSCFQVSGVLKDFFVLIYTNIRYLDLTECDLQMVGEEFSRKPYAMAVQQGSPLKDQLNDVYVI